MSSQDAAPLGLVLFSLFTHSFADATLWANLFSRHPALMCRLAMIVPA
jgi:hypothetical protein